MTIDIKQILLEKKPIIDKAIEKYIPRKFDEKSLESILGKTSYKYSPEAATKAIAEPIWDMLDRGGKRWRPTLFLLIVETLGSDTEKLFDFVIVPEVIHNGTLVHDDIEDRSEYRRNELCTHMKYGLDIGINVGDVMFFMPMLPFLKTSGIPDSVLNKAFKIYVQDMIAITFGQGSDIAWHNGIANADSITEEEYLQMCANKTGCLARMSAKLAAVLSGATEEQTEKIGKLAESIGVAFQIQDDILNLIESGVSETKGGVGEDITEGKRTLMVIHTLQKASEQDKKRLIEILNMHTTDQSLRNEAIAIIKKHSSIEYAKERARKMIKESWEEVDKLFPPNEAKEKIKAFADFLVERDI